MLTDYRVLATLPASDLDRARTWYEDKLGLSPADDRMPGMLLYRTGGGAFMVYASQFAGTAKSTAATLFVPDLDGTMGELRGRGVTFEEYDLGDAGPTTVDGVATDPSGGRAAWLTDSEGNILALAELPPGSSL